jgi:hypothetical protein
MSVTDAPDRTTKPAGRTRRNRALIDVLNAVVTAGRENGLDIRAFSVADRRVNIAAVTEADVRRWAEALGHAEADVRRGDERDLGITVTAVNVEYIDVTVNIQHVHCAPTIEEGPTE